MHLRARLFIKTWFSLLVFCIVFFVGSTISEAKNYSFDNYNAEITVNSDSSVSVTEEFTYTFNDEMNGMFREITLTDSATQEKCASNPNLQCGGFDLIDIKTVQVDGKIVPEGRYETSIVSRGLENRLRVQYAFDNAPILLKNITKTFTISYEVYGSLGFFEKDDYILFYWDSVPADRDKAIKNANVKINYPTAVDLSSESSRVTDSGLLSFKQSSSNSGKTITYNINNLHTFVDFTILQKIPFSSINPPSNIKLKLSPSAQTLAFSDVMLKNVQDGQVLRGIPNGTVNMTFSADDYVSQTLTVEVLPDKEIELEINLNKTPVRQLLEIVVVLANIIICGAAIFGSLSIWGMWYFKGRDKVTKSTIVPEYTPPDGIKPYLLGTLKDETVDMVDISATIIDLAYRGYIKIVEKEKKGLFGGSTYDFIKLKETDENNTPIEKEIISSMFKYGDKKVVTTDQLKNSFYVNLPKIKRMIYEEIVSAKYFAKSPDSTRKTWTSIGGTIIAVGVFAGSFVASIMILTIVPSAIIFGLTMIFFGRIIPAKTTIGAEMFRRVKGFKMYMVTAEKYRVQNLTPDVFEKFLSYAIVFGIEKSWAEKFKDIYKGMPSWYESTNGSTFNALIFANNMRSLNTITASALTSSPSSSSGSSTGGGWSGGGGFSGGFSGGGGGGGGAGAW